MSLKDFHIIFIIASILVSLGFGSWAIQYSGLTQNTGYFIAGIVSYFVSLLLAVYIYKFFKKMKDT